MKRILLLVLAVLFSTSCAMLSSRKTSGLKTLDFRKVVQDSKDKVFPAVVFVKCLQKTHRTGEKRSYEVSGSGVIISPEGEFLTNWHIVNQTEEIRCLLYDGRSFSARIIGGDKDLDLALCRLDRVSSNSPLPYAELAESKGLREGDFVMAMGAPWGLSRSVSIGIISCANRYLEKKSEYSLWLQTDAAISPGNSGGPLVNTDGKVVGINTLAMPYGGDMGFAVPSSVIKEIMPSIREYGSANWGWTGLILQPLRDFERDMYFEADRGFIVAGTVADSPARKAGVLDRDRIVAVAGDAVTARTPEDLPRIRRKIALLPTSKPIKLDVVREGEQIELELQPRAKGDVEGKELDCPRWDLTVKAVNQFENPNLYFHRKKGVFVYGVRHPGNASDAGIYHDDIILKIGDRSIESLEDVKKAHAEALENMEEKSRVLFTILRNGLMRQVVLDFSRDYERE